MLINWKIIIMNTKIGIQTLLFTTVPLVLQDLTPLFAFISAFLGAMLMIFKSVREYKRWRKEKNKTNS